MDRNPLKNIGHLLHSTSTYNAFITLYMYIDRPGIFHLPGKELNMFEYVEGFEGRPGRDFKGSWGWTSKGKSAKKRAMVSKLVGGLEHFVCFHLLGIIIRIDFYIFQRGWNQPPTRKAMSDWRWLSLRSPVIHWFLGRSGDKIDTIKDKMSAREPGEPSLSQKF